MIPTAPGLPVMNFDPDAKRPEQCPLVFLVYE
jgi:hypothetical protein